MKKLFGLGKGLGSLIPAATPGANKRTPTESRESVFYVETSKVKPNANQPRRDFDDESLRDLAGSIRKYGILQPLLVVKEEKSSQRGLDVEYQLIAGERRWRAARLLNLPQVPVIIKDSMGEDRVRLEVGLVENLQREDLNAMEESEAYVRLANDFGLTHQQIAERVGKKRETVSNSIRLLNLPADVKESIRAGKLARGQARALLAFKDDAKMREMYKAILAGQSYSGGDLEKMAQRHVATQGKSKAGGPREDRFDELENNLRNKLGAAVYIKSNSAGGSLVVKFADLEELNKVARAILG